MKTCGTCEETKPHTEFYRNKGMPDGYQKRCKACSGKARDRKTDTALRRKDLEYNKATYGIYAHSSHLRKKYDCTLEEYRDRMETSDCCEVCGSTENLCYDHCHDTMEFRGVLCRCCNQSIGKLGDNLEGLMRAVRYLEKD